MNQQDAQLKVFILILLFQFQNILSMYIDSQETLQLLFFILILIQIIAVYAIFHKQNQNNQDRLIIFLSFVNCMIQISFEQNLSMNSQLHQ
ncbi:hypothetical protein pb186bvf_004357 [Paramecium bursaria]